MRSGSGSHVRWLFLLIGVWMLVCGLAHADAGDTSDDDLLRSSEQFAREVDHRLDVPLADQQRYLVLLEQALSDARLSPDLAEQAFVLVDRCPQIQAAFVVVRTKFGGWHWIGATAVSTGRIGTFEHFLTPLGVFAHSLDNPDFRAEGTFNKNHIRGYGLRGRRVFDFGWQLAERGWGDGGTSQMRLQMHATDPQVLESRLGSVASEGCIRIPATLNVFLDRRGILDADYEDAQAGGQKLWVLQRDRQTVPWPGRYMVTVDSQAAERPPWSPAPGSNAPPNGVPDNRFR
ncbi:MAG: murein L,D-transpeptidase [Pseudomonadota bacterium]|nr:murein L,D-transpeptidase [Pseudomonadota bacterium]